MDKNNLTSGQLQQFMEFVHQVADLETAWQREAEEIEREKKKPLTMKFSRRVTSAHTAKKAQKQLANR